ncbi:MAG: hypothetical protein RLZZ200_322 [Pseudomonadota bacterium]|jgi:hypothetical protein
MDAWRAAKAQLIRQPAWGVVGILLLSGLLFWSRMVVQEPAPQPPEPVHCDRDCLEQQLGALMTALVAHDPSALPLSGDFQYVENNQHLTPGDGGWRTLQGFGTYRQYFADPERGTAAVLTTARENNEDALATLRIRVAEGRLAEAEVVIIHDAEAASRFTLRGKPAPDWTETVPETERLTREDLLEIANRYYGALETNDGRGDYSFFDEDCERFEQGRSATHTGAREYLAGVDPAFVTMGCRAQFETGLFGFVTRIRDRRFEVIDIERGAVFSSAMLDLNDKYAGIPLTDGGTFSLPAWFSPARTLMSTDAFRIRDNRIQRVETLAREFPYATPTGLRPSFNPSREVPYGKPADATRPCDEACLVSLAEQLLRAMAAHEPQKAPLADTASYIENGQSLEFYDGLWGTLTEVAAPRLRIVETSQHEILVLVRVRERDLAGLMALRLHSTGDRIGAIETTVVREEKAGAETLFRSRGAVDPAPARAARFDPAFDEILAAPRRADIEELVSLVDRYFDAIELGHGNNVRFTPDCRRRENGLVVTDNPEAGFAPYALGCAAQLEGGYRAFIRRVRDRHVLSIDTSRGLVLASAFYDMPGTVRTVGQQFGSPFRLPSRLGRPQSRATWQLFRIEDGAIRRIDTLERVVPYGTRPREND